MKELRFAIFGAGFWTRYQLSGWRELKGARCVAIYNRTRAKAEAIAREFNIPARSWCDPLLRNNGRRRNARKTLNRRDAA